MDRKIEKTSSVGSKLILGLIALLLAGYILYAYVIKPGSGTAVTVSQDRLTISQVRVSPFQEFITVNAVVVPMRSI
ncbi:MAG: hypothetical protein LAT52_05775, partial [Balneolales bacterium]|nr:hypothetical protein [Balneolales bacterium]